MGGRRGSPVSEVHAQTKCRVFEAGGGITMTAVDVYSFCFLDEVYLIPSTVVFLR